MAITPINVGTSANDGTGDPHRTAFQKTNNNINEVTSNGGAIINVTDPVDLATKELNTALANIYASGGTPDLQAVTDENLNVDGYAETTNGIQTSKLIAENLKVDSALEYFDFAGATPNFHYTPASGLIIQDDAQENGVALFQSGVLQFIKNGFSTELESTATASRLLFLPDKNGTLATTDDIPTLDTTPTDGSTNGVESNGVFDALALKADKLNVETFIYSKTNGTFGSHTGTTAETVLLSVDISAGEYAIGDILTFFHQFEKSGTAGNATFRVRAGVNGTTSDALISTYAQMTPATLIQSGERRNLQFITGNLLRGIRNISGASTDVGAAITVITSTSLNPTNAWKLTFTVQLVDATDTASLKGYRIGKIKSF